MPHVDQLGETYFNKVDLAERYDVTTRTIEKWVEDGLLPAPKRFSYKTIRWPVEVIEAHDASK